MKSKRKSARLGSWGLAMGALGLLVALGCGGSSANSPVAGGNQRERLVEDDHSRCEYKGRLDREVVESVGTGAIHPTIRRVYRSTGEGQERRRILACREVDTNLDGVKDIYRYYDDKGEKVREEADADYDGNVDTWIRFSKGRVAQVEVDANSDGIMEEIRYYLRGKLSRVQRDTNADGRPDVWEIYASGHLDRIGQDFDFDGRVDRWNRDEVEQREQELKAAQEEAAAKASEGG